MNKVTKSDISISSLLTPNRNLFYWTVRTFIWAFLAIPITCVTWYLNPPLWGVILLGLYNGSLFVVAGLMILGQFGIGSFHQHARRWVFLSIVQAKEISALTSVSSLYDDAFITKFYEDEEFRNQILSRILPEGEG